VQDKATKHHIPHRREIFKKRRGPKPPEVTNGDRHIRGRIHVPAHVHIADANGDVAAHQLGNGSRQENPL